MSESYKRFFNPEKRAFQGKAFVKHFSMNASYRRLFNPEERTFLERAFLRAFS
jgi:hypothetical protein